MEFVTVVKLFQCSSNLRSNLKKYLNIQNKVTRDRTELSKEHEYFSLK